MEAFLINPGKGAAKMARKRTRKRKRMSALQRYYFGGHRRSDPVRRRRRTRRHRAKHNPSVESLMLLNAPRRRRKHRKGSRPSIRRSRRHVERFPRTPSVTGILRTAKEAGFLAIGFVGTNHVNAFVSRFVPETILANPVGKYLVKTCVAVGGGYLIGRHVSRRFGDAFTLGGILSVILQAANEYIGPTYVPMSGVDEMALAAYYAEPGVSAYFAPGETPKALESQPDYLSGVSFDTDMPERLNPASRF